VQSRETVGKTLCRVALAKDYHFQDSADGGRVVDDQNQLSYSNHLSLPFCLPDAALTLLVHLRDPAQDKADVPAIRVHHIVHVFHHKLVNILLTYYQITVIHMIG